MAAPRKTPGGRRQLAAGEELAFVAHGADRFEHGHAIEVEDGLRARLVARLHAIAGEARMFCTPIAEAPSTSPWMAMRLRSRAESA